MFERKLSSSSLLHFFIGPQAQQRHARNADICNADTLKAKITKFIKINYLVYQR